MLWAKADDSAVKHKLQPGSTGLPFIGETISLYRTANSSRRRKFFEEHELRYGPIFRSNLMPASTRDLLGKYCLLEVHGELQKTIHASVVKLFRYDRLSSDFMEDIQNVLLAEMSKWEDQRHIALQYKCSEIGLKLMGKMLLDLPYSEEMNDIYKAFHDFTAAILFLPLNVPGTTYYRGIQARRFLLKKIYGYLEERREHPEGIHNDLLSKLLRDQNTFSDEIIADTLLFVLLAGYETSSSDMAFAIKFVTENPNALKELTDEHDSIIKSKGTGKVKLTWDDYQSMKFTHCVINETLRLASAATISFRETMQDVEVRGFLIPKGWTVIHLPSSIHLDEKYYYDADKFHPWRWQNEELFDKPFYMPFGGGIRLCPGLHLGKFEIALFLHYFLTKFRWEPLGVYQVKYFPQPHIAKGFPIRLYPRLKSEE
ncbi:hypothetical protein SUGI_0174630 [Cryptomeria japonica]|nr:hypothetical protein SUGI_0174630 [Cryptomeria japonica]